MKQNPQMITGSWDDITLVCGNTHDEPVNMVLQEGPSSLFYACPKYHRENRSEGERTCNNRLSIDDFLKARPSMRKSLRRSCGTNGCSLPTTNGKTAKGPWNKVPSALQLP